MSFYNWNPLLVCLACHHDISCSLQTLRRSWTYFKSVCLDWQDTVGETGLKLSKAMPGQALSSKIMLSVSDWVCFWRIHSVTGIKSVFNTTVNDITTFRLDENFWLKLDAQAVFLAEFFQQWCFVCASTSPWCRTESFFFKVMLFNYLISERALQWFTE